MIKSRSGQRQRYGSTRAQYYVLGEWSLQEKRQEKNGPSKWVSSRCTPQLTSFMESMEKLLNSVEKFPRTTLHILWEIQKSLRCQNVESERFSDRIIFMSMFNEQRSRSWSKILDIYSKSDKRFRQRTQQKFGKKKKKHSLTCPVQTNLHTLWFDIVEKKRSRRWITSS